MYCQNEGDCCTRFPLAACRPTLEAPALLTSERRVVSVFDEQNYVSPSLF
jgi:hypothetical protein